MKSSRWTTFAALVLMVLSAATIVFIVPAIGADYIGDKDFISYWAAGQQLVHGANPYDTEAMFRLQHGNGMTSNAPDMLLNMPNALFLVLPLGLVGAKTGMGIWLLASIGCLMASIRMLWIMFGRPDNSLHFFGYVFAPVICCMLAGQLGAFLLLGIVLFLYLHKSRPFWAGAALLLCAVKPHLFLPFWFVLVAWVISRREYSIIVGAVSSSIVSLTLTFFFDVHAWSEYAKLLHDNPRIQRDFVPVLSVLFRLLIEPDAIWLQYVPAIVGSVWGLWYFWTRRDHWHWMHDGLLVLLVSLACAPHAWFTDEVILLPVVFASLYRTSKVGRVLLLLSIFSGIAAIEVAYHVSIKSAFYLWTGPAWFTLYVYANRHQSALAEKNTSPAFL